MEEKVREIEENVGQKGNHPPQSATKFITKIAPPTGQSPEQFSYTNCAVFYTVFVTADPTKTKITALVGYFCQTIRNTHNI